MSLLEKSTDYISDKRFSFLIVDKKLTQNKEFVVSLWGCSDKFIYFVTQPVYYVLYQRNSYKFL